MLVPFLIMLREGVEAALIVAIVASYLKRTGRAGHLPAVWVGVLLALALSLFVGAGLQLARAEFPQRKQELFEAVIGFVAVGALTSMVFWMGRAARSVKSDLQASIDAAFANDRGFGFGLVGLVFLAVAREGLESVFFLLATVQQSAGLAGPLGALMGIAVAVALGYGIYRGGVRLDLKRFFRWTGVFILFVAAGILASSVRALHEAGIWNHLQQTVADLSGVMPSDGTVGTLLSGLFGYNDAPSVSELLVYGLYLAVALPLFFGGLLSSRRSRAAGQAS